jgi:putative transposase
VIEQAGVECKLLPPKSPNLNSHIERFMRSIKSEALSRMNFFGEASLRNATVSFLEHYHSERNHQGLDNTIPFPGEEVGRTAGEIECDERLGGRV